MEDGEEKPWGAGGMRGKGEHTDQQVSAANFGMSNRRPRWPRGKDAAAAAHEAAQPRAASAVSATLIKSEPGQRRPN